jgi:predicted AAA+ superfamily ATPase
LEDISPCLPNWHDFKDKLTDLPYSALSLKVYEQLSKFSGFPEPFLKNSEEFYNIWFQERKSLLIREDIRNAYAIRELSNMEVLSNILPERIGSPLSINALREDINASFYSIKDWILILEQFYYLFRIQPFSKSITRSLKKEPKIYLYDWCEVPQETFRFENIIALHLFKAVNIWRALGQGNINLFYLRDKDKKEVDFLIAEKDKPVLLVECKLNDENISGNLLTFQEMTKAPVAIQVVNKKNVSKRMRQNNSIQWIVSAERFLAILP